MSILDAGTGEILRLCPETANADEIIYADGVVLIADRRIPNPKLAEAASLEKIQQIDENIACVSAGLVADARVLVDYARLSAQVNRVTYAEPMTVELLVRRICDYKQQYTQFGGVRPFGTALLVGGYDDSGIHLFETEPSGSLTSFKAASTGGNKTPVMELFEQKYRPGMDRDAAVLLALEGMRAGLDEGGSLAQVEVCTVQVGQGMTRFGSDDIQKYVGRLPAPSAAGKTAKS
jgi:proteasome alpha subunit